MPQPTNKKLYSQVKSLANKKFKSPSGIYRSSWIVREYKKRGGKYSGSPNKNSGLKRWFREKWIDINRPVNKGRSFKSRGKNIRYSKCGRSSSKRGKYPLCRPSRRINSKTPRTYMSLSKYSIKNAKMLKQKYKYRRNVSFDKKSKSRKPR